jgi:hypothetical protein
MPLITKAKKITTAARSAAVRISGQRDKLKADRCKGA